LKQEKREPGRNGAKEVRHRGSYINFAEERGKNTYEEGGHLNSEENGYEVGEGKNPRGSEGVIKLEAASKDC